MYPVIASVAQQSFNSGSTSWRLLRHFVPRNDELIRGSLILKMASFSQPRPRVADLLQYLNVLLQDIVATRATGLNNRVETNNPVQHEAPAPAPDTTDCIQQPAVPDSLKS